MFYLDYIDDDFSIFQKINNRRKRLKTSYIGDFNSYYGTNVDLLALKMKIDIFKLDKKTLEKIDRFINIILEKNVVLSNSIIKNEYIYDYLVRYLKLKEVNVLNNIDYFSKLYEVMILDVLTEVVKYIEFPKNKLRIGIMINTFNQDFFYYLEKIGQEYKEIVIITKSEIRLDTIIQRLYEEYGIIIIVNNKSLFLKSDIIINYGLKSDEKFIIGKSIILDIRNNDNIKLLDGIRISSFNLDFDNVNLDNNYYTCYFNNLENFDYCLNELDKVMVVKKDYLINTSDIEKYTTKIKEDNIFEFVDDVIKKNMEKVYVKLDEFIKNKEEPAILFANVASQYRLILSVKNLIKEGYSEKDIASELKVHPYRIKLAHQNSYDYSNDELVSKLLTIGELDEKIKKGLIDKYVALKLLLVDL